MLQRRRLLALLTLAPWGLAVPAPASAADADAPALLLAQVYRPGVALQDYWVSEKYDGVRGYWDGQRLRTRGGEVVNAPAWFTANWPAQPLDGELWAGRGQFAQAQSTTARHTPDDAAWRQLRFMVFDLPAHGGSFDERLGALQTLVANLQQPWVQAVPQQRVATDAALQALLQKTVRGGGEGLMLHRGASLYRAGRSDDLVKVKTHEDTEARVVAHLPARAAMRGAWARCWWKCPQASAFAWARVSAMPTATTRRPWAAG